MKEAAQAGLIVLGGVELALLVLLAWMGITAVADRLRRRRDRRDG